jgi:mono/diheme cytochrome c family protein
MIGGSTRAPLLVLVLLLAGCSPTASLSSGNARTGSLLFVKARCLSCHTVNGMGGASAPDLTHNITSVDFDLLRYFIEHPPSQMAYVKTLHLTDTDIHNLNAFADSALVPQASTHSSPGNATKGAQLFVADKCIDCHTVNGVGGTNAQNLTNDPTATSYDLLKAELDTPPPAMSYVTGLHLSKKQIQNLSKFFGSSLKPSTKKRATRKPSARKPATRKPARKKHPSTRSSLTGAQKGARLFTADKCIDCHTVNGVGGTSAKDLTGDPNATDVTLLTGTLDNPPLPMSYVSGLHLTSKQIRYLSKFFGSSLKPAARK